MFMLTDFKNPKIVVLKIHKLKFMKFLNYKVLDVCNFYSSSARMIVYPRVVGDTREFPALCMSSDEG